MSGLPVIDGGSPLRIGHIPPTTFGGCETQPFFAQEDAQKIGIRTVLADYPKCGRGDKHGLIDPQRAPPTADYIVRFNGSVISLSARYSSFFVIPV
ncbi:hypothetical protein G8764_10730 [Pseudomaricurvus alcaniphilus]|nr:hypothetical protein [Pseudomaricurvus alcaniphilus]